MSILVIDADSIVYAAAFAAQDWALLDEEGRLYGTYQIKSEAKEAAIHAGDTVEPFPRSDDEARELTDSMVENIIESAESSEDPVDEIEIWLTAPNIEHNFRFAIYPEYKSNRKNYEKPAHYQTVRDHLTRNWGAEISREGWEADDEVAAAGWDYWNNGSSLVNRTIICSIDKDLNTVPGHHYRWPTHNKEGSHYFLTEEEARHNYWCQVLMGDKSDNIPGLHRIGEKRSSSLLSGCTDDLSYYNTAKSHWIVNLEKEGYTEAEAVEKMHVTCQLLYLMRGDNDEGWRPPV